MTFVRFCAVAWIALALSHQTAAFSQTMLPEPPALAAPLGREHPLAGRIIRLADDNAVDPAQLVGDATGAAFVLLGEKHDNPDHHRLQAWMIEAMSRSGRRPAVAMEMLSVDQAPALARYLGNAHADAAGLGAAVGWQAQGWPDWAIYEPIAEAALRARLPIVVADLAKAAQRSIGRDGLGSLPGDATARLQLMTDYDPHQAASLARELRESHCGHVPEGALQGMAAVQRARDAHMAAAMIDAAARPDVDGAVLIAGAGHVRRDRGVPWHLARMAPGRRMLTIAFREVDDARTVASQYAGAGVFDYVWFTPRLNDEDPCERFKEQLRRMRQP